MDDFEGLLDLENFAHRARYRVLFQVIARTFASYDLHLTLFHGTNFELVDLILAIDVNLDSECHLAVIVWRGGSLASLQRFIEDGLVPVEVPYRAQALQLYVDGEVAVGLVLGMARFELWVIFLDVLGKHTSRANFSMFH